MVESSQPKVVAFPGGRRRGAAQSPDEKLAANVRKAWRGFQRACTEARQAGLILDINFNIDMPPPGMTRKL